MSYDVEVNLERSQIVITSDNLKPFTVMPGVVFNGNEAYLPFNKETAEQLASFLKGKEFTMTPKTRTILGLLKRDTQNGVKGWVWSLDLTSLQEEIINPKARKALRTAWDLIHYMPLRYIDKSNPQNVADLQLNDWCVVIGEITQVRFISSAGAVLITVQDVNGATINSWFFHQPYLMHRFREGQTVVLSGTYSQRVNRQGRVEESIANATIEHAVNYETGKKIIPVYSEKAGKKKWDVARQVETLLNRVGWIEDPVPQPILDKYDLMTRNEAYRQIHFPDSLEHAKKARQRIAFDDFVRLQVFFLNQKTEHQATEKGNSMVVDTLTDQFTNSLPFEFTGAQKRVAQEIKEDMHTNHPMRRLVHGEVSSGKAQPYSSPVLTPDGFKRIGDLRVGDTVITQYGTTKVHSIHPQGKRPVHLLHFSDGSEVEADENHLWSVKDWTSNTPVLRTTAELRIILKSSPLPILLPNLMNLHFGSEWHRGYTVEEFVDAVLNNQITDPGYIQSVVASSDHETRQHMLNVMTPNHRKGLSFTGNPSGLVLLRNLTRSLGGVLRFVDGMWVTDRLLETVHPYLRPSHETVYGTELVKISYLKEEETVCIKLDDEEGLYVTNDFVVTHNTEIAATAALRAVGSGYQVALLAPTGILATQLWERMVKDFQKAGIEDVTLKLLHTGTRVKERRETLAGVADGTVNILIGTHSLLSKEVQFNNLGLVVIDEQHKFGTKHRQGLQDNYIERSTRIPDLIMMSATPIPRTMAQTVYGDLDLSVIDELPAERKPVITYWDEDDSEVWEKIREEVKAGHQAYVIAALVDESDSEQLEDVENATQMRTYLQTTVFPELNVGLVHGKLKPAEKTEVLESFYRNETNVLVSTSVIEVGVNVPNATVMVVLNANRFGIASLHQIRGRVGRGDSQAYCYLIGTATNPDAEERLNAMVASNDGFWLAEKDLEIRGEGSLLTTNQHGDNDMLVANLREHRPLLTIAQRVAGQAAKSSKMQEEVAYMFKDGDISA